MATSRRVHHLSDFPLHLRLYTRLGAFAGEGEGEAFLEFSNVNVARDGGYGRTDSGVSQIPTCHVHVTSEVRESACPVESCSDHSFEGRTRTTCMTGQGAERGYRHNIS